MRTVSYYTKLLVEDEILKMCLEIMEAIKLGNNTKELHLKLQRLDKRYKNQ